MPTNTSEFVPKKKEKEKDIILKGKILLYTLSTELTKIVEKHKTDVTPWVILITNPQGIFVFDIFYLMCITSILTPATFL